MATGRRPTALEVKEQSGSFIAHPERRPVNAPRANGDTPAIPDYFDDHASSKWYELCADLQTMGIMSSDNREIMIAYCTAYSGWRRCLELVRQTGPALIERDANGKVKIGKNHLSVEMHKYREQMNRLLPEFGLTPASRSKLVSMAYDAEADPFEVLLTRLTGAN